MLESERNDQEFNDHEAGGAPAGQHGASEPSANQQGNGGPSPAVPAAVFQPPQVVFQPPAVRPAPEPASRPDAAPSGSGSSGSGSSRQDRQDRQDQPGSAPGSSGGGPDGGGDDEDGTGSGRKRRRRSSSRSRSRNGDQDTPDSDGTGEQGEPQAADTDQAAASDANAGNGGNGTGQPEGRRSRSRRSAAARDAAKDDAAKDTDETGADPGSSPDDNAADQSDGDGEPGSGRRRRRKRRRGSADGNGAETTSDDPPDTVVHVREPNGSASSGGRAASDDVRSVKGSTRLEAKKQRRREGRETGRRRPPIITESEFLARRESVERTMVVRQRKDRTQIAVLEDSVLVEHYVNRSSHQSYVGNVYLGKVQNVLPSMEAAFVDIGKGRNAVLYAGEVNFDVSGLEGQPKRIEAALKSGQAVIVQVTKDPVGHKGARLTSMISLPGRYLVYVPGSSMTGISRKLPDTERNRLKQILKKVMPENAGVIVRTAAEGAAEEELARDVSRLAAQWEAIEKKAKTASAPALLYSEPDLTIRVIRDVFNEDFHQLVVAGDEAWEVVEDYVSFVAPHLAERLIRWDAGRDVFAEYRIDEQLAKALDRKVWLPSGGSLVIDKTEAMTVIDVNTGKFTGQGGNLEETVTRNNLEAAEEIVRQLRLRDVGGIVVIDFIDMVLESNRELVLRRLLECLARDRTKHQVAEVTSLGLVQMTRKRVGAGLLEAFSTPCECCNGRGVILNLDADGDAAPVPNHTHGRGNGGAAVASPASVAARARPVAPAASDATEAVPADSQPADSLPADSLPADSQPAGGHSANGQLAAAPPGDAEANGAQAPGAGQAPAHDGDGAQNGDGARAADGAQAPDDAAEPVRTGGGRRRRRKPAAAATAGAGAAAASPSAAGAGAGPGPEAQE